jgi:hypothetical protein
VGSPYQQPRGGKEDNCSGGGKKWAMGCLRLRAGIGPQGLFFFSFSFSFLFSIFFETLSENFQK